MIEIKPYMELDENTKKISGITKKDAHTFFMVAKDKDEILGIGTMKIFESYAEFYDVWVCDEMFKMLNHGIGKAMLNFIERREIYDVISENENISDLLYLLRFKKEKVEIEGYNNENEIFYLNLKGYFDAKCSD